MARRASPSAAAPTVGRNTSSVAMAAWNPRPAVPTSALAGTWQSLNSSVASGCGAITSMRSTTSRPGVSASTTNALSPRAPGPSPVRANTT
jgi:hypothetical protein